MINFAIKPTPKFKVMKRLFFSLVALLLASASFANAAIDSSLVIVPINRPVLGPKPPTRPKQIVGDDITAQYYNGVLTIDFNIDLGTADIVVTNLTTGEAWSDTTSGLSSVAMLLSGDGGYYTVEIATDYGTYSGVFEL